MKPASRLRESWKSSRGTSAAVLRVVRCYLSVGLLSVCLSVCAIGQFNPPAGQSTPRQGATQSPPAAADESESESDRTDESAFATRPRATDPATILRTARTIFVHSKTIYVKDAEVENALRKRPEFRAWGLVITRDEGQADLVIEVERKLFTKRFVFSVIEPRALVVVTSGKARSIIFGDTIAHKVAEKFVNRMAIVRPFTASQASP